MHGHAETGNAKMKIPFWLNHKCTKLPLSAIHDYANLKVKLHAVLQSIFQLNFIDRQFYDETKKYKKGPNFMNSGYQYIVVDL